MEVVPATDYMSADMYDPTRYMLHVENAAPAQQYWYYTCTQVLAVFGIFFLLYSLRPCNMPRVLAAWFLGILFLIPVAIVYGLAEYVGVAIILLVFATTVALVIRVLVWLCICWNEWNCAPRCPHKNPHCEPKKPCDPCRGLNPPLTPIVPICPHKNPHCHPKNPCNPCRGGHGGHGHVRQQQQQQQPQAPQRAAFVPMRHADDVSGMDYDSAQY